MKRDEIEVDPVDRVKCPESYNAGWNACLRGTLVRQMVEVLTDMLNENNSAPYVANLLIQRYREAIK